MNTNRHAATGTSSSRSGASVPRIATATGIRIPSRIANVTSCTATTEAGIVSVKGGETLHRVPGYSSSSGRALAAFDDGILADTLAVPRRKHTPFTITDSERLHRVLRAAREAGYVSTREEFTRGFSSVAAPVLLGARPLAAISVVGPTTRILGLRRDFIVASVCRAAQRVNTLIGVVYETQH